MKRISLILLIAAAVYSFSSCTKTNNVTTTIHDTTVIIHKDTIYSKDTLVLTNPKNPITGYWVGTYQIDGSSGLGSFFYGWSIFPDHTVIQQGGGSNGQEWTGKGTWALSADSTFTADIGPADISQGLFNQHITAKYSAANGTLSNGKYTYTSGPSQTGTFSLKRVD